MTNNDTYAHSLDFRAHPGTFAVSAALVWASLTALC